MKARFKVYAGIEKNREPDKITVQPDVSLGDIPYYIEVENNKLDNISIFKSVYVNSMEKNHIIAMNNVQVMIGEISGKVYEIKIATSLNNKLFSEVIKLIKNHIHESHTKKIRYRNNVSFSLKIIKEAYGGIMDKASIENLEKELE